MAEHCEATVGFIVMLCVPSPPPAPRIPSAMEHGVHNGLGAAHFEEDAVWEPPQQRTAHYGIDELMSFRMTLDGGDRRAHGQEEVASQAWTLCSIPRVGLMKIKLRLRRETKPPYPRRSSLARTLPQDLAAAGLRECA